MKFIVLDREERYVSNLKKVSVGIHPEEINGEDVLEMTTLDSIDILKNYRILYENRLGIWKEFIVKEVEEIHEAGVLQKTLFCESSFYETLGDYIEYDRLDKVSTDVALTAALAPTRWEVGIVDNPVINSTYFYNMSSKEAVQKITKLWECEIRTRVVVVGNKVINRYVDLFRKRGQDLGKRFTYSKDLTYATKIVHRDDVITALYGYGKGEDVGDGYGWRLNFSEINQGKAYVEDENARLTWGRNNPDGTKAHVFDKVEFDDCEDMEELLALTSAELEKLSKPLVTYEFGVVNLGTVELGDTVNVIDREFVPELRLKARVVKIERDLLEEENSIITLGNFIPSIADDLNEQSNHINNFRSKQGVWDRAQIINEDGTVDLDTLNKGILTSGKVSWNLQNDTFLIGNNPDDFLMYFNGSELMLGPDVVTQQEEI